MQQQDYPTYDEVNANQYPQPIQNQPPAQPIEMNQIQPIISQSQQPYAPVQPVYQQPIYAQQAYAQPIYQQPYVQQGYAQPVFQQVVPVSGVPYQYLYTPSPLDELANLKRVIIDQQIELLEVMTGCETKNRYHVYGLDPRGAKKFLFLCKEESGWCMRTCCPAKNRSFVMKFKTVTGAQGFSGGWEDIFAEFNRPFKCTCCCLGRPEMIATRMNRSVSTPFGKVIDYFAFCDCDPKFHITDLNGNIKYTVTASCCQCGLVCKSCTICSAFADVHFNIHRGFDINPRTICGYIGKKSQGLAELVSDADSYVVEFPDDAGVDDKLLIIGVGLMIDYRYFEDDTVCGDDDEHHHHHYHH